MTHAVDELPTLDPFDPDTQLRMPDLVADLHAQGHWIYQTPMWLTVIDDAAARDLWRDDRFSTPRTKMLELQGITDGPLYERATRNILALAPADHTRVRRLVSPAFTPRSIDRLRPMMRAYLDERVAALGPAGRCELVDDIAKAYPIAIICAIVVIARFLWVFPGTYLPRLVSKRIAARDSKPPWQYIVVIGFTGIRGVVSLAVALALPLTLPNGQDFPHRDPRQPAHSRGHRPDIPARVADRRPGAPRRPGLGSSRAEDDRQGDVHH